MVEPVTAACRLCSYRSDQRLMLGLFEERTRYGEKINDYLNIKVSKYLFLITTGKTKILFRFTLTIDTRHVFASTAHKR